MGYSISASIRGPSSPYLYYVNNIKTDASWLIGFPNTKGKVLAKKTYSYLLPSQSVRVLLRQKDDSKMYYAAKAWQGTELLTDSRTKAACFTPKLDQPAIIVGKKCWVLKLKMSQLNLTAKNHSGKSVTSLGPINATSMTVTFPKMKINPVFKVGALYQPWSALSFSEKKPLQQKGNETPLKSIQRHHADVIRRQSKATKKRKKRKDPSSARTARDREEQYKHARHKVLSATRLNTTSSHRPQDKEEQSATTAKPLLLEETNTETQKRAGETFQEIHRLFADKRVLNDHIGNCECERCIADTLIAIEAKTTALNSSSSPSPT